MLTEADTLLYSGRWHDSVPRDLILDPMLHSVDKIVWQFMLTRISPDTPIPFPSYDDITRTLNIARATAVRAVHILRLARWITFVRGNRENGTGRFVANAYVLHDRPAPLDYILEADPGYADFVVDMTTHQHARVALVARVVLSSLIASAAYLNLDPAVAQKLAATYADLFADQEEDGEEQTITALAIQHDDGGTAVQKLNLDENPPVQNLNAGQIPAVQNLNSAENPAVQNLNSDANSLKNRETGSAVQILNSDSSRSSSSYLNKKTTTGTQDTTYAREGAHEEAVAKLAWPDFLGAEERQLATGLLKRHDPDTQQALLDELAAQKLAKRHTPTAIRNAVGYLAWMSNELGAGRMPLTSHGVRHRQLREREARHTPTAAEQSLQRVDGSRSRPIPASTLAERLASLRHAASPEPVAGSASAAAGGTPESTELTQEPPA